METEPLNPDDSRLDSLLREGLARPELPDGGFTQRVLATLPRAPARALYRPLIVVGWIGSTVGVLVAFGAGVPWRELGDAFSTLGPSAAGWLPCAWAMLALSLALAGGAASWYFRAAALDS